MCGFALKYANKIFKEDKEIVLEAVKSDGWALQFVGKKFLKDPSAKKHYPALEEGTISGTMVTADEKTGLAIKVEPIVFK